MTQENALQHPLLKPLGTNTTYTLYIPSLGEPKKGLNKQQIAEEILAQSWNMNHFVGIQQNKDDSYSLGGERHYINSEGDWDGDEFERFRASTLDEALDFVLYGRLNKQVFPEDDELSQLILSNAIAFNALKNQRDKQVVADKASLGSMFTYALHKIRKNAPVADTPKP